MALPVLLMFSGQGSQYARMGAELYRSHPRFRATIDQLSPVTLQRLGMALPELIYDGRGTLERALHSSPAIYATSLALADVLHAEGVRPAAALGYSLGELVALAHAGWVDRATLLDRLIQATDALEQRAEPAAMLAVLDRRERAAQWTAAGTLWLATANLPDNVVMVGREAEIGRLDRELTAQGRSTQRLPVTRGFHSPLVDPAEEAYRQAMPGELPWAPPATIFSCALQRALRPADVGPAYYWQVVRAMVDFERVFAEVEARGPWLYVDAGPSGTLATLAKYLLPSGSASRVTAVLSPFGSNATTLQRALAAWRAA